MLDLALVVLLALAALLGFRRGAIAQLCGLVGLFAGLLAGSALAAPLTGIGAGGRLAVVAPVMLAGGVLGRLIGRLARRAMRISPLRGYDEGAGAVLRPALVITLCWLVSGVVAAVGTPSTRAAMRDSNVLVAIDGAMPSNPLVGR